MKNLLLLVAFLFTVVCYAAPPTEIKVFKPDKTFVQANDVAAVAINTVIVEQNALDASVAANQYTIQNIGTLENPMVPEVAYYRKNSTSVLRKDLTNRITDVELTFKCPQSLFEVLETSISRGATFDMNKQNSNYGYPLSARTKNTSQRNAVFS